MENSILNYEPIQTGSRLEVLPIACSLAVFLLVASFLCVGVWSEPSPEGEASLYAAPGTACSDADERFYKTAAAQGAPLRKCKQLSERWRLAEVFADASLIILLDRTARKSGSMTSYRVNGGRRVALIRINPSKMSDLPLPHEIAHHRLGHAAILANDPLGLLNVFLDVFCVAPYLAFGVNWKAWMLFLFGAAIVCSILIVKYSEMVSAMIARCLALIPKLF